LSKKGYTPEQIINKLREAEVMTARGETMDSAMRRLGVTKNTFYRWRKEYGGLRVDRAKRLKELETENSRLKRIVADLSLDVSILREAVSGNF
jgi:transposase-like protein